MNAFINNSNFDGKVVKCIDIHGAGIGKTASDMHIKEQIKNLNI